MIEDPIERAEASLLGRILADEEAHAAGAEGERLLEQVRKWGITSGGLFSRGYHRRVWKEIQEAAREGKRATRQEIDTRLRRAVAPVVPPQTAEQDQDGGEGSSAPQAAEEPVAPVLGEDGGLHPETAHVSHLLELTDVAEEAGTEPETAAAMVVDAAMHRSVHDVAVEIDRAAHAEDGDVAGVAETAREKLSRMKAAWSRLPESGRKAVEATRERPEPTPIMQARQQLDEARSMMAQLRADPAGAAQMIAEPAWGVIDKLAGALDGLANTSIDARRSPATPENRTFLRPGEIIAGGAWAEHRRAEAERQAAEDARDDRRRAMVRDADDQLAFAETDLEAEGADGQRSERHDREARLLGSIVADPSQLDQLTLEPSDVDHPGVRRALEVARELRDQGVSVDAGTLDWALLARGEPSLSETATEPVTPQEATRGGLAAGIAADAARDRLRGSIGQLRDLGRDPSRAPGDLISAAEQALDRLGGDTAELTLVERLGERHDPDRQRQEREQTREAEQPGRDAPQPPEPEPAAPPEQDRRQAPDPAREEQAVPQPRTREHPDPGAVRERPAAEQPALHEERLRQAEEAYLHQRAQQARQHAPPQPAAPDRHPDPIER